MIGYGENITRGTQRWNEGKPANYRLNINKKAQETIYKFIIDKFRPDAIDVLTNQNSFNRKHVPDHLFTLVSQDLVTKEHHDTKDSKVQGYSTAIWLHDGNLEYNYYFNIFDADKVYKIPLLNGTMISWNGLTTKHSTTAEPKPGRKASNNKYGNIYSLFTTTSKLLKRFRTSGSSSSGSNKQPKIIIV